MTEKQESRTTMSVLKMMGAVNADGTPKTPPIVLATKPLSGRADDKLGLSVLDDRARDYKLRMMSNDERADLKTRIAAGPAKIAAAKERGADPKAIQAAALKLAELGDKLAADTLNAARWYVLSAAYSIARDFRVKAGNDLADALSPEGGSVTIDIPGVITFRADLAGTDDEPPF